MSNSPLVEYVKLSPNHSGGRLHTIDRITPHCVVGQCTAETLGDVFSKPETMASSNYGIDRTGRIALYVPENCRSWCSSSAENDNRSITIECASDSVAPYRMNDSVYSALVEICVDLCKRNGKSVLLWTSNKSLALSYEPKPHEMVLTVHRWFAAKDCPGEWLYSRLGALAATVTRRLAEQPNVSQKLYKVQVGAFKIRANAERRLVQLQDAGYSDAFIVEVEQC